MGRYLRSACICSAVCLWPLTVTAAAENLIPNGGFEDADPQNADVPQHWTAETDGQVTAEWSAEVARGGRRSLATANLGATYAHAWWTSGPIAVKPGMAYRVSFHFMAEGGGTPIFQLNPSVKSWRLTRRDTAGQWLGHEDVVVIPPGVGEVTLSVHNYNRPDKKLWFDDAAMVELPLSESPLTKRFRRAEAALAALEANAARLVLAERQQQELADLAAHLNGVRQSYRVLESGRAKSDDFERMLGGLDALEKGLAVYRYLVWIVDPAAWQKDQRQPSRFEKSEPYRSVASSDGSATLYVGMMSMVGEGLPGSVSLAPSREAKSWQSAVDVTPASEEAAPESRRRWGRLNPLGEVYLPPDVPRYVRLRLSAQDAKPGEYSFTLTVCCLDRLDEAQSIEVHVDLPAAR